jgi:hypothetical protein
MFHQQAVIYTARTMQDAYLLRNLLAEEGIRAIVVNAVLEGGSGVDIVGWPTLARVVVDQADAERARHIALVFDRKLASTARDQAAGEPAAKPAANVPEDWPRCPECDLPRSTRCPICGTAGSEFGPADAGFLDVLAPGAAAEASASCSCGPGGCGGPGLVAEAGTPAFGEVEPDASAPMLMCPTCDEPFVPKYLRRCEWCGHEFADGIEAPETIGPDDQINARVIFAILLMLLVGVVLMAYFLFLM